MLENSSISSTRSCVYLLTQKESGDTLELTITQDSFTKYARINYKLNNINNIVDDTIWSSYVGTTEKLISGDSEGLYRIVSIKNNATINGSRWVGEIKTSGSNTFFSIDISSVDSIKENTGILRATRYTDGRCNVYIESTAGTSNSGKCILTSNGIDFEVELVIQ